MLMQSKDNDEKRAYFILHVGPSKTGTSSIQCTLSRTPFLQKSDYMYIGRAENPSICGQSKYNLQRRDYIHAQGFVFGEVIKKSLGRHGNKLKREIETNFDKNTSVILSAEEFDVMGRQDEESWDFLSQTLGSAKNRTRVIITYRHFHEKIVSLYQELIVGRRDRNGWKAAAIPSFPEAMEKAWSHALTMSHDALVRAYSKHFDDVKVFDFHGKGDLVTRFICDLPNSHAACEAYKVDSTNAAEEEKKGNTGEGMGASHSRPSRTSYAQADRIAVAAYKAGLISNQLFDRLDVANAVLEYVQNSGWTFLKLPRVCPSEKDLNAILAKSIEDAQGFDIYDASSIQTSFEEYKEKGSYCAVNITAVVEDEKWKEFFQGLKKE
jgi:hypothetical protein